MATQTRTLPDGSKVYWDPTDPSGTQYRVDETTGDQTISTDGGATWTARPDANQPGDLLSNFGDFVKSKTPAIAQTAGSTLTALAKGAPALIAAPAIGSLLSPTIAATFGGADAATDATSAASPFLDAAGGPYASGETGMAATTAATNYSVPTDLAALSDTSPAGGSTLAKIVSLLPDAGKAIGAATTAAGQNDLNQEQLGLTAANTDITGQQAYTNEEIAVAKENAAMQQQQLKDKFMLDKAQNPGRSPFDPTGTKAPGADYVSSLSALASAAPDPLAAPTPYKPITPSGAQAATGTTPGTLSKIGQILGPALTLAPKIASFF